MRPFLFPLMNEGTGVHLINAVPVVFLFCALQVPLKACTGDHELKCKRIFFCLSYSLLIG